MFEAGCFSCQARAVAAIGAHSESERLKKMTPEYQCVLKTLFGDNIKDANEKVKEWGAALKLDRAKLRGYPAI